MIFVRTKFLTSFYPCDRDSRALKEDLGPFAEDLAVAFCPLPMRWVPEPDVVLKLKLQEHGLKWSPWCRLN